MIQYSVRQADKASRKDALCRISAKQGWYDAQAGEPSSPHSFYSEFQVASYYAGFNMGAAAAKNSKQPFGEIDSPRVPA